MRLFQIALCFIFIQACFCYGEESPLLLKSHFSQAVETAQSMPRLHSLLVSHEGELVLEQYFNGKTQNDIANVKSVSKSIISALVGIATTENKISINSTLGELFSNQIPTESEKRNITVEDLLTMRSGLETTSNRNYGAWVLSDNWIEFALNQPLQATPGTGMQYSTGSSHLLSAIITNISGDSTLEYARKNLAQPLGFHLSAWPRDPQGIYFGGNDMEMTPQQMLAFGELYLNFGEHKGKQIIPEKWVEESFRPRGVSRWDSERYYGYGWWLREMSGYTVPYAWGYGGQFIMLVPELGLVVVATSDSLPGEGRRYHTRRMYDLVEELIIRPAAEVL